MQERSQKVAIRELHSKEEAARNVKRYMCITDTVLLYVLPPFIWIHLPFIATMEVTT